MEQEQKGSAGQTRPVEQGECLSLELSLVARARGPVSCRPEAAETGPGGARNKWRLPANEGWRIFGVCLFLAAAVWVVFGQALGFQFVSYDDGEYVFLNPYITGGLSLRAVLWAFTHNHASNWYPLTTMAHMLDCQLYGLKPWGHHLGNLLLHGLASALLFLALRQLTGAFWRSAFVAAIWAVHPLRVESVAWVSARKDVLSGAFFMLMLLAYARYSRRPSVPRYLAVAVLFAFGLMSKPTLIMAPFALLLLDWWPLNRFAQTQDSKSCLGLARLPIWEKLPLLFLSALSFLATWVTQQKGPETVSSLPRVGNALVSYFAYLAQMVWPVDLAVLYPYPVAPSIWQTLLALALLAAASCSVFIWRRSYPWLTVGWLWYLGMLLPVIGIFQIGAGQAAHADRYTYLPHIGLCLLVAWTLAELSAKRSWSRWGAGALALVGMGALAVVASIQTTYWYDSESLWRRAADSTANNQFAHNSLGVALRKKGRLDEAIEEYQKALAINPGYQLAHNNLGNALVQKGRLDEAIAQYRNALQLNPDSADALNNLAFLLATCPEAHLRDGVTALALAQRSNQLLGGQSPQLLGTLAAAYAEQGRFAEAIRVILPAIELAQARGDSPALGILQAHLRLYQAGKPLRVNR